MKRQTDKSIIFSGTRQQGLSLIVVTAIILVALFLVSFAMGRYPVSPLNVLKVLTGSIFPIEHTWPDTLDTVVMQIRLPRIIAAILVGSSSALAGTCLQGLFRNPLVSPDILGVASGAGFGAAVAILLSGGTAVIQIAAFLGALLAVSISYAISKIVKSNPTLSLILAGIAIGSFFSSLLSLTKYVADPINQLPTITYWLMGSLASINTKDLCIAAIPIVIGTIFLVLIRWRFNVLAMGEEEALALGMDTGKLRAIIIICSTMITAASVCISGTIGWIGLVIPHIGRALIGPDHQQLVPFSIVLGATYLLIIDDITRAATTIEIPIGILTAIIGVPFFVYLLYKNGQELS